MAFLQFIGGLAAIVLAVSLFFVIRMTRKVSIPLETMAAELAEGDPGSANFTLPGQAPLELHTLAKAIEDRDKRIQSLLERERVFNRDASHELRTPLAVARGAVEVIEETGLKGNAFTRLQSSLQDMQLLTEGILWLGREPNHTEGCDISAICKNSMETYKHLTGNRDILVRLEAPENVQIPVPEPVAQVLVGNLLRNAIAYTDKGEVCLSVRKGTLLVTDTGVGFGRASDNRTGFGVGLSLVKRLCTHFGIAFEIKPLEPNGSVASLTWTKQSDPV
jgi:signal transduction histidine kinase